MRFHITGGPITPASTLLCSNCETRDPAGLSHTFSVEILTAVIFHHQRSIAVLRRGPLAVKALAEGLHVLWRRWMARLLTESTMCGPA